MSVIVTSKEGPVGDTLVTFPAIIDMAKQHGEIYFAGNHYWSGTARVDIYGELLPKHYNIKHICELPRGDHQSISLHIGEIRGKYGHLHMTKAVKMWCGLPDDGNIYYPIEIDYEMGDQPQYDIVCCAMNNGPQLNGERQWAHQNWTLLLHRLRSEGYSICMLGTSGNGRPYNDVDYYYDHSLRDVAAIVKKSRVCVTIDTGISHIAHAVSANTVLIHSSAAGLEWSGYPSTDNRITHHGYPPLIAVDTVYNSVKRFL